jgi:PKD repeat protein
MLLGAAPALARVVSSAGGVRVGIQPLASTTATHLAGSSLVAPLNASSGDMTYHGGPVVHGLRTYAIFWDPAGAFEASSESLVSSFLADSASDSGTNGDVFSVAAQYGDPSGGAQYAQTFGGAFVDRDPYPPSGGCSETTATAGTCLYDSQEVTELESFVASHGLPTGLTAVYAVLTPDTVVTCMDGGTSCSNNDYCSFHSYATDGLATLLYIGIPFTLLDSPSDAKSCQDDGNSTVQAPNGDPGLADVALKSLTHEMLETVTDPLLNAWYDASGNEVADACNDVSASPDAFLPLEGGDAATGTLYNQTIAGAHYYLQGAWSNEAGGCALVSTLTPSITAPASVTRGAAVTLSGDAGTSAPVAASAYVWSFGDGQDASSQAVTHSYDATGTYTVTLTVTDSYGDVGSTSQQIVVTAPANPGKTAGASGSKTSGHKHDSATRCGPVSTHGGKQTRRCTTTTVSHTRHKTCASSRAGSSSAACRTVAQTVTRRQRCRYTRSAQTSTWSHRCAPAQVVKSAG